MKTIFVPSDFSRNADTALRYAIQISKVTKARIIVFHCAHLSPYILASASATQEQLNRLTKEDEAFKMKKLLSHVKKAYKYVGIKKVPTSLKLIVESEPLLIDNILSVAKKNNADIIITGTHGATGLNRYFFGSNTATLISRSEIPVLAIPNKYRFKKIRKIIFASDLEHIENELNRLVPLARAIKAGIDVLYLDYGIDVDNTRIPGAIACISKSSYQKIQLIKQKATIEYSMIKQLRKYMERHKSQWLVMFTKDRKFWDKIFFGGKTAFMCYSIKKPLLSFKK